MGVWFILPLLIANRVWLDLTCFTDQIVLNVIVKGESDPNECKDWRARYAHKNETGIELGSTRSRGSSGYYWITRNKG